MSATTVLAVGASSMGLLMAAAPLLQLRQIRRRGSASDVSVGFLAVIATGAGVWSLYGLALGNWALIMPNVVGCLVNAGTATFALGCQRGWTWQLPPASLPFRD
jgi:uncharacterized protein with PQ loop repeat